MAKKSINKDIVNNSINTRQQAFNNMNKDNIDADEDYYAELYEGGNTDESELSIFEDDTNEDEEYWSNDEYKEDFKDDEYENSDIWDNPDVTELDNDTRENETKDKKEESKEDAKDNSSENKLAAKVSKTASNIIQIIIFLASNIWFTVILSIGVMILLFSVVIFVDINIVDGNSGGSNNDSGFSVNAPYIDGKYMVYMPIKDSTTVTSGYGWRNIEGWKNFHNGIDFSVKKELPGTQIYAALPGKVVKVKEFGTPPRNIVDGSDISLRGEASKGQYVVIEHKVEGFKLYTIYMHMYRINVHYGQDVGVNTVIGIGGNTGASTGAHLHFEIRLNSETGKKLNPAEYIYNLKN